MLSNTSQSTKLDKYIDNLHQTHLGTQRFWNGWGVETKDTNLMGDCSIEFHGKYLNIHGPNIEMQGFYGSPHGIGLGRGAITMQTLVLSTPFESQPISNRSCHSLCLWSIQANVCMCISFACCWPQKALLSEENTSIFSWQIHGFLALKQSKRIRVFHRWMQPWLVVEGSEGVKVECND